MHRKIEVNRDPDADYADTSELVRCRIYREEAPSGPMWCLDAISIDGRYSHDVFTFNTFGDAVAALRSFIEWIGLVTRRRWRVTFDGELGWIADNGIENLGAFWTASEAADAARRRHIIA